MDLRGVILAGGTGSRLMPLTKVTNKHLLPVGQKPMIYYPIEKLASIGIAQILIVTGIEYMGDVVGLLGSGREFGCQFTYKVQDEAGGIAQALGLAENFAQRLVVILGDNIFQANLKSYADRFISQKTGARILLKQVPKPQRFGVAQISNGKIVGIDETPKSLITHVKDRPGHDRRYAIEAKKIMTELGWRPSVSFEEGIRKTIDWYLQNQEWLANVVSGDYQKYYEAMYANR